MAWILILKNWKMNHSYTRSKLLNTNILPINQSQETKVKQR